MFLRREREHVSQPLNAVVMSPCHESLCLHRRPAEFPVLRAILLFDFCLLIGSARGDGRSGTIPENRADRLHNALCCISIWRKRGLLGGFAFGQQPLHMRRNVRSADRGRRDRRATILQFLGPMSMYVFRWCEARTVDADHVEGRGNPRRIHNLGRASLQRTTPILRCLSCSAKCA